MTFAGMSMCEFCLNEHPPTGNKKIPVRAQRHCYLGWRNRNSRYEGKGLTLVGLVVSTKRITCISVSLLNVPAWLVVAMKRWVILDEKPWVLF